MNIFKYFKKISDYDGLKQEEGKYSSQGSEFEYESFAFFKQIEKKLALAQTILIALIEKSII